MDVLLTEDLNLTSYVTCTK